MDNIRIKMNDTYPTAYKLQWEDGDPIDLTTVSKIYLFAVNDETGEDLWETPKECEIYGPPTNGEVIIRWEAADTAEPGMFRLEFELHYSTTEIQTVPSGDIIWMWIMSDLGQVTP